MRRLTGVALAALTLFELYAPAARAHAQAAAPFPVVPLETPSPRRHLWAYASMVGGVGLIGFSDGLGFSRSSQPCTFFRA